jgi:hypothetical protein
MPILILAYAQKILDAAKSRRQPSNCWTKPKRPSVSFDGIWLPERHARTETFFHQRSCLPLP